MSIREGKKYLLEVSAHKAALADCVKRGDYEIIQVGSGFAYKRLASVPPPTEVPQKPEVPLPTPEPIPLRLTTIKQPRLACSTVASPTKLVWHIADQMVKEAAQAGRPPPTRAQVVEQCLAAGIAWNTARTQYQAWSQAVRAGIK